jgi:hypothetical protein
MIQDHVGTFLSGDRVIHDIVKLLVIFIIN